MSAPDLTEPIRDALLLSPEITAILPSYKGSFPIFTRRPVPDDSPNPRIVVSQDITLSDQDGISDFRPQVVRDVAVYHTNEKPENERIADDIAQVIRTLFHRKRFSLSVPGWAVASIQAEVPIDAAAGSDQNVAKVVQLTVLLSKNGP